MNGLDKLSTRLKEAGYSVTSARRAIFEVLEDNHPVAMAELVKLCDQNVDRASVYRTIEIFEKLDIVSRLNIGWKYKLELSGNFTNHHHHLSCVKCGKTVLIKEGPEIEKAIMKLASDAGFTSGKHQLEIHGLCKTCQTP